VIVTNRNYLARALKLGFREVLVFQTDRPVLCQDLHRCYAWAPLEPKDAIKSGKYPIRIESPAQHSTEHTQPTPQERKETMPRRKASDYGVAPANGNGTGVENGNTNETSNGAANGTTNGESAGEVSLIDQAEVPVGQEYPLFASTASDFEWLNMVAGHGPCRANCRVVMTLHGPHFFEGFSNAQVPD